MPKKKTEVEETKANMSKENAADFDQEKFDARVAELLELGKKKKNILEYQEIVDFFKGMNLAPDKLESVLETLEGQHWATSAPSSSTRSMPADASTSWPTPSR